MRKDLTPRTGVLWFIIDIPRNLLIGFLKTYRKIISPIYGDVCRYFPSCSAYGLEAVTQHGAIKGIVLTAWRVLRCNPFSHGGVDQVPEGPRIWPEGKLPRIIVLNHPVIPDDEDAADSGHKELDR
ncbi:MULTISPECIES: membrane protein insertion efficiency factor YidD [Micrococcaceae]|uniref:membrane protein insertion efficiency factor YidD n=1 Tax=Micrococcaceae TaxID=1268 RepID=UPI000CFD030D|nr:MULTISPECIES: membrane protein insertion efficiency factor YidD [Micrococcaceae]PRB70121.1 membrane protein insertion efficiency factor YidD [Arthrobacter sp. MYb213]HJX80346.1 membrane protein insertion efficiency factor YidD [Glutamicibacter sp.]